ncbi:response regulator [Solidesulfovibrio sp.]
MRRIWGYVGVTALLSAGTLAALVYILSGDRPTVPVWAGGEIRIGYSSEPPYSFRTPDGTVTGEGPEIAKVVFAAIGATRIRWVLLDFGKAIAALDAGQIDCLANCLFITPERSEKVLFSLPFSVAGQGLLVRRGNPHRLASYEAVVAAPDVVAAVLDGSVEQQALVSLGMPAGRLFAVPDPGSGLARGAGRQLRPAAPLAGPHAGKGRVLVVEDDAVNRMTTVMMLKKLGFGVEAVEEGDRVLDALAARPFDVVLMDIQMPRVSGDEATRRIRQGGYAGVDASIPVIALTAHAMEGDRERYLACGMDEYLSKPVDVDSLRDAVIRAVAGRRGESPV